MRKPKVNSKRSILNQPKTLFSALIVGTFILGYSLERTTNDLLNSTIRFILQIGPIILGFIFFSDSFRKIHLRSEARIWAVGLALVFAIATYFLTASMVVFGIAYLRYIISGFVGFVTMVGMLWNIFLKY